ncbi:MAG: tRNA (N(6)-L-threonylcarbamoyladenosine(37)-C(2))-methylthiotransferase MtaB [bacterium]|nr:tRNA (N(6)-L-threonylcarbamoyladenosine(37)-C(2))-methylthiotransferase MtaB [candidate division KSB1 bacterium]MDH7558744.1 tRNA (N(6)-L-threonylcarbamoyladenosine(37)-C(2))-methylthiotransferase MtaB [bacterium]
MRRVAIYTLGCKLNQAEGSMLAEEFCRKGFRLVPFGAPADVVVINTCSVTQRTDACSRQAVRRAARELPQAFLVVTGCYAQLAPEQLAALPGVDVVLGAEAKFQLFDYLNGGRKRKEPLVRLAGPEHCFVAPCAGNATPRTRAFLKIQDGCDAGCSYCTVPLARGPARSAEVEDVLARATQLAERGHKELVLTGVHIGAYGRDLQPCTDLPALLDRLCSALPEVRFRLSSLECTEISGPLLQVIAGHRQVCRHFHVPLQSGSDAILASMRRPYSAGEFLDCLRNLRAAFPEASIGSDVIVGYPGEQDRDFRATVECVEKAPLTYLHVFRYSKRPHTAAAELGNEVPPPVAEQRAARLRALGAKKRMEFAASFVGRRLQVLFEREADGWAHGLSDNYLRVRVPKGTRDLRNVLAVVYVDALGEDCTLGGHLLDAQARATVLPARHWPISSARPAVVGARDEDD